MRYGIIADDQTGATDVAAAFARWGLNAAVAFAPKWVGSLNAQIVALSTNSRHDAPNLARRKVRQACAQLQKGGCPILYKKIDSTVQGNIVAEAEAVRDAGGFRTALVCPANPAQGRIVRGGVLHVRDRNVVDLTMAFRLQGLTRSSLIPSPTSRYEIERVVRQGGRFLLADAATEGDLKRLARTFLQSTSKILLVGSSAMARELGNLLIKRDLTHSPSNGKDIGLRSGSKAGGVVLIISGSNNPVTERQLRLFMKKEQSVFLQLDRQAGKHAAAALGSHRHVIVRVSHKHKTRALLHQLRSLAPIFHAGLVNGLLVIGGDTALLVFRMLRPRAVTISGEIVPGIAWGRFVGGLADGQIVSTKPGGFGADDSLLRAVSFLSTARANSLTDPTRTPTQRALPRLRMRAAGRLLALSADKSRALAPTPKLQ